MHKTAAQRGLHVAVIDQMPHAGARLRTTGILVKEAPDEMDFPAHLSRKVPGVRLYVTNGVCIDLAVPQGSIIGLQALSGTGFVPITGPEGAPSL